jgi:dynein heavy chain 1
MVHRGIFAGSADIKHLLPVESARFNNINSEFLTVMKKVFKSPFVLDVLNIAGVQKSLERLADLLSKIQKALGEYLERERSSFPRFYFVGDEDLLEIIGNSKDIHRVVKHLKKMFAGLSTLMLNETENALTITGMVSKEGEEVLFVHTIEPSTFPKINDWLAKIESEMKMTLSDGILAAYDSFMTLLKTGDPDKAALLSWLESVPSQLAVLTAQIHWTTHVESSLLSETSLQTPLELVLSLMDTLADAVLGEMHPLLRSKCENIITELVHQRDVLRALLQANVQSVNAFDWLYHMRFYLDKATTDPLHRVKVHMADVQLYYGFEYLGTSDRLVQTPLTDKCYLTLTQALSKRLGGSPFGPAGTGKTESVKALGNQLGRFVLVFCCDETFDFQSMGRIFIGLCQVGAWGCFVSICRCRCTY